MHSTETVNAPLSKRPVRVLNFFSSDRLGGVVIPRFVIVGSVAAAADVGLYTLLVGLASDPSAAFSSFWAKTVSVSFAIALAFVGNNFYSFRGTKIWSAGSRVASFFSLYFFAAAFQVVALAVWVGLIDDPTTVLKVAANSVVIAATTIFRFVFVLKIFRRRVEGP